MLINYVTTAADWNGTSIFRQYTEQALAVHLFKFAVKSYLYMIMSLIWWAQCVIIPALCWFSRFSHNSAWKLVATMNYNATRLQLNHNTPQAQICKVHLILLIFRSMVIWFFTHVTFLSEELLSSSVCLSIPPSVFIINAIACQELYGSVLDCWASCILWASQNILKMGPISFGCQLIHLPEMTSFFWLLDNLSQIYSLQSFIMIDVHYFLEEIISHRHKNISMG